MGTLTLAAVMPRPDRSIGPVRAGEVHLWVVPLDTPIEAARQLGDRPGTLLGLYEGIALTHRSPLSYMGAMPDRITIFQEPICRRAGNEDELVSLVRTTVIHEVAHHFGISDTRLHELGWG